MNVRLIREKTQPISNELEAMPSGTSYYLTDEFVKAYHFRNQRIGNILTEKQIEQLSSERAAMIIAPPGLGKTTFALNVAVPYIQKKCLRVLILASRTALVGQYKLAAMKEYEPNLLEELTPKGIKKRSRYGPIDIFSYQGFRLRLLGGNVETKEYGMVIFDECHYFVQDAAFDRMTRYAFLTSLQQLHHCRRLYLTATPEMVIDEIVKAEWNQRSILSRLPEGLVNNAGIIPPRFTVYRFDSNYTYLRPCFFERNDEIVAVIKNTKEEKFLVCVDSRERGIELQERLGDDKAEYIDAELKDTTKADMVENMVKEEKFKKQVLIATSFLDVGVNLKDAQLRNVVIYSTCKTHFLQAIGRKRMQDGEKLNLYIYIPDLKELNKTKGRMMAKLKEMRTNSLLYESNLCVGTTGLPFPMFQCKENGKLVTCSNVWSYLYYQMRYREIVEMLEAASSEENEKIGIAKKYLSWLNLQEHYMGCRWLGKEPNEKFKMLADFLEEKLGLQMNKDSFESFKVAIYDFNEKLQIEPDWRKDRLPHVERINAFLEKCDLAYVVSATGKPVRYIVERG